MGRTGLPSSLTRAHRLLFSGCCTLVYATAICAMAAAAPMTDPTARTRSSASQTVIGAPQASACADAAMAGRFGEDVIAACDIGLKSENLDRKQSVFTLLNRGAVYLRMNKPDLALLDFDDALKRMPKNADAMINRGAALMLLKRNGEAVSALTRALQLKPAQPEMAYYYRGSAREALGDIRGAYEDYKTALLIRPGWELVAGDMARFAKARRDQLAVTLGEKPAGGQ